MEYHRGPCSLGPCYSKSSNTGISVRIVSEEKSRDHEFATWVSCFAQSANF